MDSVATKLTLSTEDLDAGDRDRPDHRARRRSLIATGSVLGMLGLSRLVDPHTRESTPLLLVHGVLCVGGLLLALFGAFGSLNARGKRRLAAGSDEERELTYHFDEHGARITGLSQDMSLPYSSLSGYFEGTSAFLLYVDAQNAEVVPKRAFSAEQLELVRGLLAAHAKPLPKPKSVRPALLLAFVVAGIAAGLVTFVVASR